MTREERVYQAVDDIIAHVKGDDNHDWKRRYCYERIDELFRTSAEVRAGAPPQCPKCGGTRVVRFDTSLLLECDDCNHQWQDSGFASSQGERAGGVPEGFQVSAPASSRQAASPEGEQAAIYKAFIELVDEYHDSDPPNDVCHICKLRKQAEAYVKAASPATAHQSKEGE